MASITRWKRHVNVGLLENPSVQLALSDKAVDRCCRDEGHEWRSSFWSPGVTVITFLLQVLDGAKTLRSAVAVLLAQMAARGETDLPSCDPAAYCQARKRLPMAALKRLLRQVADGMRDLVTKDTGWLGRRVWVLDGSSAGMPDTPQLQKAFPQPSGQVPGCGFPVVQFVALFCWTTAALIDVAIDELRPHELTLFRRLWHHFGRGDVVLADRAYGAYVDIVRLRQRGVFSVIRLHQRRKSDMRQGKPLGPDDRLVTWEKPKRWLESFGVTQEEFDRLPESMSMRLVRITETPHGFRTKTIIVSTNLIDPVETPADQIRSLYLDRWLAEVNLRSLKTHLGMDILRGKSVDVVIKEIVMHMLAYNLIRLVMWQAARETQTDLHRLSFTGTLHRLRAILPMWLFSHSRGAARLLVHLVDCVAEDRIPYHPNRFEPRRVKRRPKQYRLLVMPRAWYHNHPYA